jgi:thiol:disulfide interchange protein DsbD
MEDTVSRLLAGGPMLALVAAFVAGLLSVATPCVLPMIPITLGVLGVNRQTSRAKAAARGALYVAGIVASFTALGLLSGFTGQVFGALAGNPLVNGTIALLLAVMAANAFGLFEVGIPRSLQRLVEKTGGAGPAGAFTMGLVAGIVAMPCIGPVLVGILTYVGITRNAGFGALLLATYALGFGLPFLLMSALAFKLPKGGPWMQTVKSLFGVALMAGAFWFLRLAVPALQHKPGSYVMGALAIVAAVVFAGSAIEELNGPVLGRARKVLALVMSLAGVALVMNKAMVPPPSSAAIDWCVESKDASCLPKTCEAKPVTMVVFGAPWCGYCTELEQTTLADQRVIERLRGYGAVHVNVDETPDVAMAAGVQGLPTIVFIDGDCQEMGRVTGYKDPEAFLEVLDKVEEMRTK